MTTSNEANIHRPPINCIAIFCRDLDEAIYYKTSDDKIHKIDQEDGIYKIQKVEGFLGFTRWNDYTGRNIKCERITSQEFFFTLCEEKVIIQKTIGKHGVQGYQGNDGAAGGAQGFQGNQGPQGEKGFQGADGAQGTQGDNGTNGTQGSQGDAGVQGIDGAQGFQGDIGVQGNAGPQGLQGQTGPQGNQGNDGVQGSIGVQGNTGATGFQGNTGTQGSQGDTGSQGNQGAQGQTGTQGNQGAVGVTGNQGTQGNTGPQGTQGNAGTTGSQGTQGNQGSQGLTGVNGTQGFQGNTGSQGQAGTQGVQGSIGSQGTQGSQGVQGNQGNGVPVAGATGTILRSNGSDWVASTNTYPNTTALGNILYATSANVIDSDSSFKYSGNNLEILISVNAGREIGIQNTSTGTGGYAQISAYNSSAQAQFGITSTGYTPAVGLVANNAFWYSASAAMTINAGGANTYFAIQTGGTSERLRILKTGEVLINTTTVTGLELFGVRKDQNALTLARIHNNTSGTAAKSSVICSTATATIQIEALSALFTTSGMEVADSSVILSNSTAGLNVGTYGSQIMSFWTNNTERARFLSTGEFLIGSTTNPFSGNMLYIQKNQNGNTTAQITNTTSGTGAYCAFTSSLTTNLASNYVQLGSISAGFSTSGIYQASTHFLIAQSLDLVIGTHSSNILQFWTNNTQRVSVNVGGGFIIQGGKLWMKNTVSNTNYWSGVLVSGVLTWTDSGSTALPTT